MPRQNLTPNACTVCRKKRTKCDGHQPCRRCTSRGEDCVYEDKMWRTKDHLRSEIERLRREVHQCQGLIKALTLSGSGEGWKLIQSRMHRGEPPERIAAWIASLGSPTISPGNQASQALEGQQQTISPDSGLHSASPDSQFRVGPSHLAFPTPPVNDAVHGMPILGDTEATMGLETLSPPMSADSSGSVRCSSSYPQSGYTQDDTELTHRLIYHFFSACFPDFSFICKERFMRDLNEGTGRYSSPALLNAILGLASQSYETSTQACSSAHFFLEARQLSMNLTRPSLTDIQTLGILSLSEAHLGHDESAFQLSVECARNAVLFKMNADSENAQTDDPGYREAAATTFCGAFSLIKMFRLLTGRLSCQTGPLFMRLTLEADDTATDSPAARVERGVALQQHFFDQVEHCPDLLKFIYTITEVAHTFCCYHHDDGVIAADLVSAYNQCLQAWGTFNAWLPSGTEANKDILFAQIWYNYILTVLFGTLIDEYVDLQQGVTPRAVVIKATETIILLSRVYQEHCGFQSVHPFLPHMLFTATLFQLRLSFATDEDQPACGTQGVKRECQVEPPNPCNHPSPAASPRRRSTLAASTSTQITYPPWKHHISLSTMMTQAHIETSSTWPPTKLASNLAAEGSMHLNQIATHCPKAASLAQLLRIRSVAGLPAITPSTQPPIPLASNPSLVTPVWGGVAGIGDDGFNGLGVGSLQSFCALTTGMSVQGVGRVL